METLDEKVRRLVAEEIEIVPYDPCWPGLFERERDHLRACLPADLVGRIEHFGSTAVPGLAAKPIIDILLEVADLDEMKRRIVPILTGQGYDYLWRPTIGDATPPFYAWFIKRGPDGRRTHHIHMVEPTFEHWERLRFRDCLIDRPDVARKYQELKLRLAAAFPHDRERYTAGKSGFIGRIMKET